MYATSGWASCSSGRKNRLGSSSTLDELRRTITRSRRRYWATLRRTQRPVIEPAVGGLIRARLSGCAGALGVTKGDPGPQPFPRPHFSSLIAARLFMQLTTMGARGHNRGSPAGARCALSYGLVMAAGRTGSRPLSPSGGLMPARLHARQPEREERSQHAVHGRTARAPFCSFSRAVEC